MGKILRRLGPYKGYVLLSIALLFAQVLGELYLPTLMSDIVNFGIIAKNTAEIWRIGGMMMLVSLAVILCAFATAYLASRAALGVGRDLRGAVFSHVSAMSLDSFEKFGASTLITRNTNDIMQIQQFLVMGMTIMLRAPLMMIGGVIMAIQKDQQLTLVLVGVLPLLAVIIVVALVYVVPMFTQIQKRLDKLNQVVRENLTGIRVIRAFNNEKQEQVRFDTANKDLTDLSVKVNRVFAVMMPLFTLIFSITNIAITWFGAVRIDAGQTDLGNYMAFFQYASQILFSLIMLIMIFTFVPRAAASATRVNEVLGEHSQITDPLKPKTPGRRGSLRFEDVTFTYPHAEAPVLEGVTFHAKSGETTAIIGSTGSGKSTLIQLIPRLFDVSRGAIRLDDTDIRDLTQEELRNRIGYVPQKATLFTGTIAENIRYGKEDATDEEVRHAAQVAQAADFIEGMEDGYDAMVSQGGTNLSGGQKQRLAIARALVRRPEVYIFDDSFSALDFKTDAALRKALEAETGDSTVIIVAQRVTTIMNADRIIVLEDGHVAGYGKHAELMKTCQTYREIVASQLSEEESAS